MGGLWEPVCVLGLGKKNNDQIIKVLKGANEVFGCDKVRSSHNANSTLKIHELMYYLW